MTTENQDDGSGCEPAANAAVTQSLRTNDAVADTDVPFSNSPTTNRLETPEERLARKLAADSKASESNGDADDSTPPFEAKAAATATALRKDGSGGATNSSGGTSQPSVENQPGAYRIRGNSGGFDDDEEESKQEVEYVGSRAKLANDDAVLVGTKLATLTNEGEDGEYTPVANNPTRARGSVISSLKSSAKSNRDVLIPEAFVVEDESAAALSVPISTAEVVHTKTMCGINLPTNTWKILIGAVLSVLALVAIIVGSLAGTGKIGGERETSGSSTDRERPVVLDCPAAKLVAKDGAAADLFGRSVAISSGVAVVGAYGHTDATLGEANIINAGAAYVYEDAGADGWELVTKLLPPDAQTEASFGVSTAVGRGGTLLAIGADSYNQTLGAVYLFTKDKEGKHGWTWSGRIDPPPEERQVGDYFGDSVAIDSDGTTLAISASDRSTGGLVFIYSLSEPDDGGRITWQHSTTLRAERNGRFSDKFGGALAIRGDTLVIGAQKTGVYDQTSGASYVFEQINGTWTYRSTLLPPESESGFGYEFGNSVDIDESGQLIAVGSWKTSSDDGYTQQLGAAYIFAREEDTWEIQMRLRPEEETLEKRKFGSSVAMSGDGNTVLVGAYRHDDRAGAVFQYARDGNNWYQVKKIAPPGLYKDSAFGNDIALDDESGTAVIGERGDTDAGGEGAGAAWLIDIC